MQSVMALTVYQWSIRQHYYISPHLSNFTSNLSNFPKWVELIKEVLKVVSLCPKLTQTPRNTEETRPTGKEADKIHWALTLLSFTFSKGGRGESEGETEIKFARRGNILLWQQSEYFCCFRWVRNILSLLSLSSQNELLLNFVHKRYINGLLPGNLDF